MDNKFDGLNSLVRLLVTIKYVFNMKARSVSKTHEVCVMYNNIDRFYKLKGKNRSFK